MSEIKIKVNQGTQIYIVAPANIATGGPELLHQLAFSLRKFLNINTMMFYVPRRNPDPVHYAYKNYDINFVRNIIDDSNNVLILPEIYTKFAFKFKKIRKVVWWLSVDNYFFSLPFPKGIINRILQKQFGSQNYLFFNTKLREIKYHLFQSEYAKHFLLNKGFENIAFLSDYLNKDFLSTETDKAQKRDIVVYNPQKGHKFTKKIINFAKDIDFIPLENMTRTQVIELLQKAKVYIDFGFHPGKDRIPREAAILDCCVIINKKGAAKYFEDVPINDEFKFEDKRENIANIVKKIRDCFDDYQNEIQKFSTYKDKIKMEEANFIKDMKSIFIKHRFSRPG